MISKLCRVIALALTLGACAASGTIQQVSKDAPQIDSRHSASVVVRTAVTGREQVALGLQQAIMYQLTSKRVFNNVQTTPTGTDIIVDATVTSASEVDQATRVLLGALAGQAELQANVKILDAKSNAVLGEMLAHGKSSGGHVFAGTTTEAIDQVATQIADYLLRNRRI
jgi:hypothetical protein